MKNWQAVLILTIVALAGCKPEVGSRKWCENMDEKQKGDWTAKESAEYLKSCVFRNNK